MGLADSCHSLVNLSVSDESEVAVIRGGSSRRAVLYVVSGVNRWNGSSRV
jgi:hypothetical protein